MTPQVRRLLKFGAAAAVLAIWAVTLRPQALGGGAMYIVVRGSSMQPTYQTGDLVIVESASAYVAGDIVAYRVPSGEIGEGHVIVHRIVSGDPAAGFVVRGDNNNAPDPWSPRISDIAGRAWLVLPGLGSLIAFVHQPVVAGGLAAGVMVSLILARPVRRSRASDHADTAERGAAGVGPA
jgi:signal peptidase I